MTEVLEQARQQQQALYELERAGKDIGSNIFEFFKILKGLNWREVVSLLIETEKLPKIVDTEASHVCVMELQSRMEPDIFDLARDWCLSSTVNRRCYGASILGQLNSADNFPYKDAALPIVEGLLDDPCAEVVDAALFSLGHLNAGNLAKIVRFASNPSAKTRFAATLALLWRPEPEARSALIRLSSDLDDDVRDWATFGLGEMLDVDTPEIRDALAARLRDPHRETRDEAIKGLALRKDERVEPVIIAELQRSDVGNIVFEACAVSPDTRYIESLEDWAAVCPEEPRIAAALEACRTGIADLSFT